STGPAAVRAWRCRPRWADSVMTAAASSSPTTSIAGRRCGCPTSGSPIPTTPAAGSRRSPPTVARPGRPTGPPTSRGPRDWPPPPGNSLAGRMTTISRSMRRWPLRSRLGRMGHPAAFEPPDGTTVLEGPVVAGYTNAELEAALTTPADPFGAAFFDVDNTMLRGASLYWLARGLASRDYVSTGDIARFAWSQLKFRLLASEDPDDVSKAREDALAFVKGWPVEKLEALCQEIFDELMAERIWSGTHALAQLHLAAG